MDRWKDGRMDKWIDERMDKWINGINGYILGNFPFKKGHVRLPKVLLKP